MRRFLLPFGFLAALGMISSAAGQSRPHLELIRGLRTNGLPDLAIQYLDELKTKNPPPEIAVLLPLEYARTRLVLASLETDEGKRNEILKKAKTEFDLFRSANPKHPQKPFADIDLARLSDLRGKVYLTRGKLRKDEKARAKEMTKAREQFKEAGKLYQETLKTIERLKSEEPELRRLAIEARLDQAINLYNTAMTYADNDPNEIQTRAKDLESAKNIFEKIMLEDEKNPVCYVARAWASQCSYELGDQATATAELNNMIIKMARNPIAQAGIRTARYFRVFHNQEKLDTKSTVPQRLQRTIDECSAWLSSYRSYRNTPEGLGMLYERASKRLELALLGATQDKKEGKITALTTNAQRYMEEAEKDFKELAEIDNEYSDQANYWRTLILVTLADVVSGGGDPEPEQLGTFEKCYLQAQVQNARLVQYRAKKGVSEVDIKKEESRRYKNGTRYLEYALAHRAPSDPLREVINAHLLLIRFYYLQNFFQQAAILAEHLARTYPRHAKASLAAQFAMECYNQSYSKLRSAGDASPETLDADIDRLKRIARFAVSTWPNESSSDQARHILGFYLMREKKYDDAWPVYLDIKNSYQGVNGARMELGALAFAIIRPSDEPDPTRFNQIVKDRIKLRQTDWNKTIKLLEELPAPETDIAEVEAISYCQARTNLALLYQLEGKFDKVQQIGDDLLKSIASFTKLKDTAKVALSFSARAIVLNAKRGQALEAALQKNHARVDELLKPAIEEMAKDFEAKLEGDPPATLLQLRRAQREALIVALQSAVQDGKIDRASELLDLMEKSGGSAEGNFGMMRSLVSTIRGQIEDLRKDPKTAGEAKSLAEGFTTFLDKIAPKADLIKDQAGQVSMKIFLAQGYSSVDSYTKAASLLESVRTNLQQAAPPEDPGQLEVMNRQKRQVDYALARNYRLGKLFDKGEVLFKEIIGGADAIRVKENRRWGFAVLDVRKEYALFKEDVAANWTDVKTKAKKWKEAIDEWSVVKTIFIGSDIPPPYDPKRTPPIGTVHFVWAGSGLVTGSNFLERIVSQEAEKAKTSNFKKRTAFFDIFLDQSACYLRAYHSLGAEKYDASIAKVAQQMVDFQAKNPDLGQDQKDRIKSIMTEYPLFRKKFEEAVRGNQP